MLDPVNAAMTRLEGYFGLSMMTMLRYRNGLCLLVLWNAVIARIMDLPKMHFKFIGVYVLVDSTIGRLLAFCKLESALFLAAIIWHLSSKADKLDSTQHNKIVLNEVNE